MKRLPNRILGWICPIFLIAPALYGQGQTFSFAFGAAQDYPGRTQPLNNFFSAFLQADYFPTDHLPFGLTFKVNGGQHTNLLQRFNEDTANKTGNNVMVKGNLSRYSLGIKLAFHESEFTWNPYFSPKLIMARSVSRLKSGTYDDNDSSETTITDHAKMQSYTGMFYAFEAGLVFTPLVQRQKQQNRRCFYSLLFSAELQRSFGRFEYHTLGGNILNKTASPDFEFIKEQYRKNAVVNSGRFSTWQFSAGILIKIRFLPV